MRAGLGERVRNLRLKSTAIHKVQPSVYERFSYTPTARFRLPLWGNPRVSRCPRSMTKVGNDSADWRDTSPDSPLAIFHAKQATCYRDAPELSPLSQLWRPRFWSTNPRTPFSGF